MTSQDSPRTDLHTKVTPAVSSKFPSNSLAKSVPLAGRYHLEAPLGHGTASVFRARDLKTGVRHAIKRLPRDAALEEGEYERFVSEVTLLSELCHPNIVTMTALHREESGRPFLVMELLEGEDALTHLAGGQQLPLLRVLAITRQVVSALHAAHRSGITHREFKLSSIFLAMQRGLNGEQVEVVKVVGFGGVKVRALSGQLVRNNILGTAEYLAPEGISGCHSELDEQTDQWAVAVSVYRMLSGRLPFRADDESTLYNQICTMSPPPLTELCPEVPQHVVETIERALAKDKAQRFPSLAEFMRVLSGQTQSSLSPRTVGRLPLPRLSMSAPSSEAFSPGRSEVEDELAEPTRRSCIPESISMSEIPTVATKLQQDRTLNMEAAMLDKLCAESKLSELRSLPSAELVPSVPRNAIAVPSRVAIPVPTLPGSRLIRAHQLRTQRHQTLAMILGSCIGLGLGMSVAWLLAPHAAKHLRRSPPQVAEPQVLGRQAVISSASSVPLSMNSSLLLPEPGLGIYRVCVQPSDPMDIPWRGSCRAWD